MEIAGKATYAAVAAGTTVPTSKSVTIEDTVIHTTEVIKSPTSSSATRHKIHAENRMRHQRQKERRKQYNKKKAYELGRRRRGRKTRANCAVNDDYTVHAGDTHADDLNTGDYNTDDTLSDDTYADHKHDDSHSHELLESIATTHSQTKLPFSWPKYSASFIVHFPKYNRAKDKPPEATEKMAMGASLNLRGDEADTQKTDCPKVEDGHVSNGESSPTASSSGTEQPICCDFRKKNRDRSRGIGHGTRPSVRNSASELEEPSQDHPPSNEDASQEETLSNVDLPSQNAPITTTTQAEKPELKVTVSAQSASSSASGLSKTPGRNITALQAGDLKGKAPAKKPDFKAKVPAVGIFQSDSSSMTGLSKILSSNITAAQAGGQRDVKAHSAALVKMTAPPIIVVSKPERDTQREPGKTSHSSSSGYSMTSIPPESPYSITPLSAPSGYSMTSLPSESPYSSGPITSVTGKHTLAPNSKGAIFWDLTTEGFPCAKAGCQKTCAQWDGQSCICPACGPLSKIRYCKKEHLREAVREHWPVCGYFSFQKHVKTSSIQDEVIAGPPMIPSIYNSPSLERHRQALWFSTAQSEGDYFIFNDRADRIMKKLPAGHEKVRCMGKLLFAIQWSSPAEKDKFRRCLAVCLLASVHVDDLVDYVYRMIRDNLRSQFKWTNELSEILREQLWLETEVEVEKHSRHACLNEWTGFPPRHCQDPTCIAERKNLLGELGVISGLEHMCQFMEAQHWLLRANRTTHPTCKSITGRILGEGYGDWVPVQDRILYRRGEGWDGVGTGPIEYEGPHWR